METNEEIDVLDQEEEIDIYDDICNFDLGEEIERLKAENKKLEEHICSLKADIDRLNGTIAELKVTQNNLTKNISSLFMSAKTEIERKNRMIEELREKVENRRLRSFKPDFKKRKDRENSPSEANKSKRYKYDESTTRCEVREVPDNDKLEPKPDERQELHSKYSNRQRPVGDSRYQQRFKYPYNKYSNQFENNKYDSRLRYSNETYTESNKFEFKNKHYNQRYNNYEDDGYHSRSTYSYDRYRNEMEERYDSRSQYCNDRYKNWTNNRIDGDGTYDNRDYNRNSRSNVEDGDGGQERFDTYADNRRNYQCDSSYYRNERNRSFERPGCSRSGTPFTPFASDVREDTGQNREQDASNVAVNSEMNPERERSLTPMPLPEDIDEPKPKPPKKRLKMLEDMEKKVRQNRLSQTTRLSDQCATNKPSDIDKHNHSWSYDSDRNSITSSKSTKSSKSDRESQGSAQRKEANLVKEKISVKNKTGSSKEEFSPRNHDIHSKKDIKRSPKKETTNMKRKIDNTVEHHMKEMISKLFCSPLELNNEKHKMTNECVSKEPKQKCSKISNAETEQKSNVQESSVKREEKDVQRTANNGSRKHTQDEIRSSTKNSPEALSVHRNQPEDKILKKPSQIVGFSPDNKRDKKREDKIKETKNQENTDKAKNFENIGKPSENVNKSTKAATNEEIVPKKRRNSPHFFEEPCNSEKPIEDGKENIRKQSVDKVDGQGKTEERVVVKAVVHREVKTTEESVKYSQRCSIRSSKERVVASKDGTTESEQKDKNVEEGKESIRKKSVDKGLNKDNVAGQGKAEEKVVAKVAMHREMKTTEEFVKHSIRRSKEKVVASKEGTTESEQKDKNAEETTRQNNKKVEKQDLKDTDKEQKQKEIIKWPTKMDTDITDEKRQNKEDIKQASDVKGKQDAKGSNKPSRQPTTDSKPEAAKQEVTKEDRRKDKSPISKKDVKDKYSKIDPSKKKYNQLIENQFVESARKEGLKENLEEYATKGTNTQLETNKNENVQSEHNFEHAQKNAKRKRKKSDSADQDSNIKNKEENPVEHSTKKEKKRECIISKGDDITKIKESEPSHKQKKGKLSTGSMVKQSHKDKNIAPKHDVDTDVPIQTDEKVIEQCMAVSSEEIIQKQVEKRPMEIFAKQDLTDDKNTKLAESIKIKKSIETAASDKNIHKNEDSYTKTNTNQAEQRNRVSDARRRIRFADKGPEDQNGHNKVTIKKKNICEKITEVDQVVLEESEKEQNNSDETNVTTIKTDDLADKNKKEAGNSKNKNPRDSLTEVVTRASVSTTSSSTDSETDSEKESSDDIFSSIKTVNKLIEIKDVEQERSRQIESVISLTDSSTSDDTVVMSYVNDSKTIEKKFDDLVSHYMENFATENVSDNPEEALHTAVDYSQPAPNTDDTGVEVKSQANHLLKENVDKTSEPKIKVLEVINIVNVHKKIELFKSSNDEEVTMVKSKECNTEKPVTTCSNSSNPANQNISPRSARRRITPTPVRDKPLCSFENILTKTSQPDPFTASLQSIGSPLQLTHEGEIPILHLDENHINDLPTEVNINDKNIMNLLDSMNISNIECDIPKFKSFSTEAAVNSEATNAIGGSGCGLTFENKIEKTSTPIKSQVTKSGASNVPNCGGASTSNASSNTQAAAVPSTIQRRRRRCWMIVKD